MSTTTRPFTGRHFTLIMIAFFGVVIAVNLVMARFASATFGGVVVENSYVASQHFNGWLGKAKSQEALGWSAQASRTGDGRVALAFIGAPMELKVVAVARHPLGRLPDAALDFARQSDGRFVSAKPLLPGRWRLRVEAISGADQWRKELDLQ